MEGVLGGGGDGGGEWGLRKRGFGERRGARERERERESNLFLSLFF